MSILETCTEAFSKLHLLISVCFKSHFHFFPSVQSISSVEMQFNCWTFISQLIGINLQSKDFILFFIITINVITDSTDLVPLGFFSCNNIKSFWFFLLKENCIACLNFLCVCYLLPLDIVYSTRHTHCFKHC